MSKKQDFIDFIVRNVDFEKADDSVREYWAALVGKEDAEKPMFTDNGKLILQYMKDNVDIFTIVTAKQIGEGLMVSSRTVSGAIRKLVTDGYVEKIGKDPTSYSLTEAGKNIVIE